ncbi:Crp/Fnr family transcriptional regulator [Pseudoflavitalea sp. G-6-1-2]|uniref:Crp/Fnr family transcriptional regulator n=1 Tax=Pseudoflavitalea sp. G-6-1-2 TaxID=2728841 RepID=UPI00146D8DF3|nr:Crp/Fnr family transcriptional regulator [Pseudoflavitalea sp. G-6-1-2]NML21370.1 Crp/Fnr family transcriptional regulator [Pseudoflavitalea sp. G-6-1-2]
MHELLIRNFNRHVSLSDAEAARIPDYFQHKKIRKKQLLLEEGDICKADYFVLDGCLRQYETDKAGKEHVVQFALAGWWISDLYSMLTKTPAVYSIDALEDSNVLLLDLQHREKLFQEIPALNIYWRVIMENAFIALQRRIILLQKPVELRYQEFLQRYAYFEQHIPQHQIASYLGITRESLSRVRNAALKSKEGNDDTVK